MSLVGLSSVFAALLMLTEPDAFLTPCPVSQVTRQTCSDPPVRFHFFFLDSCVCFFSFLFYLSSILPLPLFCRSCVLVPSSPSLSFLFSSGSSTHFFDDQKKLQNTPFYDLHNVLAQFPFLRSLFFFFFFLLFVLSTLPFQLARLFVLLHLQRDLRQGLWQWGGG